MNLDRAIEDYLAYLHVERGLAAATIRAYRSDLRDFERSLPEGQDAWARSADPAVRYLAARTRRGEPGERPLAPTSLRRRAAALKGFYRFAFGEGLIDVDVATHLDLPRQSRRLPDTLDVAEVDRLLEAASAGGARDRALLELLYAAGLRVSEGIGLDREDLSLDGAFVRVIGKGDKERLVPIGEVSIDHLDRVAGRPPPGAHRAASRRAGAWRAALPRRSRAAARAAAGVGGRDRRSPASRSRCQGQPAHAAALVRDPSARRRCRPARGPGVARACEYLHDPAVHAPDRRTDQGRLSSGPSAGLTRRDTRGMGYSEGLLSTGERITHREKQHWFVFVWGARYTILAIIIAGIAAVLQVNLSSPWREILGWAAAILFIGGLLLLGWTILRYINQEYVLTNRRVIQVEGVLNKKVTDSSLEKVNDVVLTQSVFGRVFGFGDLEVLTASESGISKFRMLVQPVAFKRAMLDAKHEYERDISGAGFAATPPLRAETRRRRSRRPMRPCRRRCRRHLRPLRCHGTK